MRPVAHLACSLALLVIASCAQEEAFSKKSPSVTMTPVPTASVTRGKPNPVELRFRISSGFHVNSNTPTLDYLIPTAVKLEAPTDMILGVSYPAGEQLSFPFAPEQKLSVYSGNFAVSLSIRPLSSVLPGSYVMRGQLRYQACDNSSCYPPKELPIEFDLKVSKAQSAPPNNPAQSPHVH
jgi:hypothetical protein